MTRRPARGRKSTTHVNTRRQGLQVIRMMKDRTVRLKGGDYECPRTETFFNKRASPTRLWFSNRILSSQEAGILDQMMVPKGV